MVSIYYYTFNNNYPSPTRSVCKDTVVDVLVIPRLRVAYARIR